MARRVTPGAPTSTASLFLTLADVATRYHVPTHRVRTAARRGSFPAPLHFDGGAPCWSRRQLDRWDKTPEGIAWRHAPTRDERRLLRFWKPLPKARERSAVELFDAGKRWIVTVGKASLDVVIDFGDTPTPRRKHTRP